MPGTLPDQRVHGRDRRRRPHPRAGRGKRAPLSAAGPIGDRVRQEQVGDLVELPEPRAIAMRGIEQRQHAAPALFERVEHELPQRAKVRHLPTLPRRLEPPRMRERTGRKRGVGELPDQEIRHGSRFAGSRFVARRTWHVARARARRTFEHVAPSTLHVARDCVRTENTAARAAAPSPVASAALRRRR